ncbi:uncharacterized protein C8A04DRAFT_13038 [Dichotomopilus funicola]|uniref:U4/U6 snRNA-associated-splicing factor PRP24 n=1 Tax=Dichotomopilus funicola TaxID=1934379 RepID=A0AAN6V0S6_9PEZI|nr:hypothetical protein C8A04DRAFT_13038 [Dichotomopilus funicola]
MENTPVGEDNWVEYADRQLREATSLEARKAVQNTFRKATHAEPGSIKVWMAFCEYFWKLYSDSQSGSEVGWSPADQRIAHGTFTLDAALSLWQEGYEAVTYRLADSHVLWDRWVSLEMNLLRRTATDAGIRRITHLFKNRLATPHATWDDTAQNFSNFLSDYNRRAYESEMQDVTRVAQTAKRLYNMRDPWETKLTQAAREGDPAALRGVMSEYTEWEIRLIKSKDGARDLHDNFRICLALFSRALTGPLASDESTWLNYCVLISTTHTDTKAGRYHLPPNLLPSMLDVLRCAVCHIPWSGPLWARYILTAEEVGLTFHEVEGIKHAATDSPHLDRDGMMGVVEMYSAWCGYLKRSAMNPLASEEAVDIAEVGLPSALEDVTHWGKRKYGETYQGDPQFRLEKILIQFLTDRKDDVEGARRVWEGLSRVEMHANSYDFWISWYQWEMVVFASARSRIRSPTPASIAQGRRVPTFATRVFQLALKLRTIDWPERIMEVYLRHCNDYELPEALREAQDTLYKTQKGVAKRREKELRQAALAAQEQQQAAAQNDQPMADAAAVDDANLSPGSKRKRENTPGEDDHDGIKRARSETYGDEPKRDRENTSVWVANLPKDATQTKLKQFFRGYGHINNIDLQQDEQTATALIELGSAEDARSALVRDAKYFGEHVVQVTPATDCTLFVTNYPPEADEQYLRSLFKDCGQIFSVRFPSLKYNTKRRFCYVTFRERAAAAAATKLDGKPLESGKYKLLAKYSDPAARQNRRGAQAEERELHIVNLPRSTSEDDVHALFAKAGRVVSVRVPRNMAGQSHGTAFVVMDTKAAAQDAIKTLDKLIFGSHPIKVELSRPPINKITATNRATGPDNSTPEAGSPAPGDGEGSSSQSGSGSVGSAPAEIAARTIALLNVPDTMTDARLRAVLAAALPSGAEDLTRLVLHPQHGGAVLEFASASAAGKAALTVDGLEVDAPSGGTRTLRTGTVSQLLKAKGEKRVDRVDSPAAAQSHSVSGSGAGASQVDGQPPKQTTKNTAGLMPPPPVIVRRPAVGGAKSGGPRRALGFLGGVSKKAGEGKTGDDTSKNPDNEATMTNGDGPKSDHAPVTTTNTGGKSNDDFKKLFLGPSKDTKVEQDVGEGGKDEKEAGNSEVKVVVNGNKAE